MNQETKMTKKVSVQTKSFVVLFFLALLGTFLVLRLRPEEDSSYGQENVNGLYGENNDQIRKAQQASVQYTVPPVDTTSWKIYTSDKYGLSFKYKPDWKVTEAKAKDGFNILEIDPGIKYYNMKIYISPKEFYVLEGLPARTETIGGELATNVNNALYGIKSGKNYFTFDVGLSMSLVPDFNGLVHSVQFQ